MRCTLYAKIYLLTSKLPMGASTTGRSVVCRSGWPTWPHVQPLSFISLSNVILQVSILRPSVVHLRVTLGWAVDGMLSA